MPPPPTYRTGSSLSSSSSSPAPTSSSPADPVAATTAFDRAKAFRERLESARANTAVRTSTGQQSPPPPPPPPPPPTGTTPSTLPPAPASLPTRPTLAALSASAAPSAPTSQPQVPRAREVDTIATNEGKERGEETFPIPSVAHTAPPPAPPTVPFHLYPSPAPYPGYIPSLPSSAYPISSLHPSPLMAPMGASVDAVVEHALGVVGVSREEWEDTERVERRLLEVWEEKILPHPASHLPPSLPSSLIYLLSTLLTPPSLPLTSPPLLLKMAAYLTMVEKAREGGGGGEWARVHECLVEGWRGALLKEREREREESGKRREEEGRRREVVQENRELKKTVEQQQSNLDRLEALATQQVASGNELADALERAVEASREADAQRTRVRELEKERDEAVEREKRRREDAKPSRRVALLLEDLDKSNSARASLQTQLDSTLAELAEARAHLASTSPAKGGSEQREREMAEADRLILEGRLEVVEREKKELEGRLRAETERRKKAEEEEVKLRASTPAPTPSPSTTAGNGTAEMDKLRAELKQNKFVIERLAGKVKELNKEVSDRRDENG
ncbi:RHTO0S17e03466g1_1 [Rhodotorula toruloides]|uniref:RHTO0S17e03466g1_1 n=1 Tax=Rhodotorula toruloides TaxID=5286 RepID=A0A061BEM3_RHOTO|nr:RHTO0S17e03466g1_1 [Rhodotorula toruloides]